MLDVWPISINIRPGIGDLREVLQELWKLLARDLDLHDEYGDDKADSQSVYDESLRGLTEEGSTVLLGSPPRITNKKCY